MKHRFIAPLLAFTLALSPIAFAQEDAETYEVPLTEVPLTPAQQVAADAWTEIIKAGDVDAARKQLKQLNFDPLLPLPTLYNNALGAALTDEHPDIALLMIAAAPTDAYLSDGQTLSAVAKRENIEVLKTMLGKPKFDANVKVYGDEPFLNRLVGMGNLEGVKLLLARPELDARAADKAGKTALHAVNDARSSEIAALLLADGRIDPNAVDSEGNSALHGAADYGDVEVTKAIAGDARTDCNLLNKKGESPLFVAASSDMDLVNALIATGKVKIGPQEKAAIAELKKAGGDGNAIGNAG